MNTCIMVSIVCITLVDFCDQHCCFLSQYIKRLKPYNRDVYIPGVLVKPRLAHWKNLLQTLYNKALVLTGLLDEKQSLYNIHKIIEAKNT